VDAARELVGRTRFATPEPVALGEPAADYPLPWSVQTWVPGVVATDDDPAGSVAFAHDLAEFIGDVRQIDTRGRTFSGRGRGGDLPSHDAWMETCFNHSEGLMDVPRLRELWAVLRSLPRGGPGDVMTHGDLEWERGQAWAFQQAMGLVWYYLDTNPAMSRVGRRALGRIVPGID